MISLRVNPKASRRVSLTPLIDVVFILLVFFMLETTIREEGGLQMLSAQSGSATGTRNRVALVELFDVDSVWVNGERLNYATFAANAEQVTAAAEVRTAPNIPIQHVVDVIDTLKERGANRVRLGKVQGFN